MYEVRRQIAAWLTEDDYAIVWKMSHRDRVSMSEWVRRAITEQLVARDEPPLAMKPRPSIDHPPPDN